MGYGIKILSGVDSIQIDSDLAMTGLRVKDSGTSSTLTGYSGQGIDEILAIRYTPSSGTSQAISIDRDYPNYLSDWRFVDSDGVSISVDWVILETYKTLTESSSGYGLQIFDANSDLIFDTGLTNDDGSTVTNAAPTGTFSGNYLSDSGPLTDSLTDYVTATGFTYIPGSGTGANATGDTFFGAAFINNQTLGQTTRNGIYNLSYIVIVTEFGDFASYVPPNFDIYSIAVGDV